MYRSNAGMDDTELSFEKLVGHFTKTGGFLTRDAEYECHRLRWNRIHQGRHEINRADTDDLL